MNPSEVKEGRRYLRRDGKITGLLELVPSGEANGDTVFRYWTLDDETMIHARHVDASGFPWGAQKGLAHPEQLMQVVTDPRAYDQSDTTASGAIQAPDWYREEFTQKYKEVRRRAVTAERIMLQIAIAQDRFDAALSQLEIIRHELNHIREDMSILHEKPDSKADEG